MMDVDLLSLLSAGGDVGTWVLVALWWRIDRRVYRLELKVFPDCQVSP